MILLADIVKAYQKFIKGKRKKQDVQCFILNSEDELIKLYHEINEYRYKHGDYQRFVIYDPKYRQIDKAVVRDRIVHQLVYDYLRKIYDKQFYFHSYAARLNKGTHKAVFSLMSMNNKASLHFSRRVFVLKCDIVKFFTNIDKNILLSLLKRRVSDKMFMYLIESIIDSFNHGEAKGIPLGNLTSQIFANVYLHELDRYAKNELKVDFYIRYMDDFVIIVQYPHQAECILTAITEFLGNNLDLRLTLYKDAILSSHKGIDFLGYVQFPFWRILRTKTKRRILRKVRQKQMDWINGYIDKVEFNQSLKAYLSVLRHCCGYKLKQWLSATEDVRMD